MINERPDPDKLLAQIQKEEEQINSWSLQNIPGLCSWRR